MLGELINKLMAFEQVLGEDTEIFLLYPRNEDDQENETLSTMIHKDISVGLGYNDKKEKVHCLFLGEQQTFDWLQSDTEGSLN